MYGLRGEEHRWYVLQMDARLARHGWVRPNKNVLQVERMPGWPPPTELETQDVESLLSISRRLLKVDPLEELVHVVRQNAVS